ncbi:hypothetical protein GF312_18305 [Candidatus Poribacteria bacterium]|nr:hypothetical protein [Candidatus Poribacteria bacterium]
MSIQCDLSLFLTKEEHSFIKNLTYRCSCEGNSKISEETVFRVLVRLLQDLELDLSDIKTEEELLYCLKENLRLV